MKVRDVMTQPPRTCQPETPLDEASRLIEETGCGMLLVLDGRDRIAGILTDRDLAVAIGKSPEHPSNVAAGAAMTTHVYTCSPNDSLSTALERMADARIRRLPVIDKDRQVRGVISIDDIVLWGVQRRGVTRKALVSALQSICSAHQPMFDTDAIGEQPVPLKQAD
jgi:CBS domain-containing protein